MAGFYTVSEFAAELGVSGQTVRNWISKGDVPALQATERGAFRIPAQALIKMKKKLGLDTSPMKTLEPILVTSAEEYFGRVIAPQLEQLGVASALEALSRLEDEPALFNDFPSLASQYATYLQMKAAPALAGAIG